jgi:hypothetical protein
MKPSSFNFMQVETWPIKIKTPKLRALLNFWLQRFNKAAINADLDQRVKIAENALAHVILIGSYAPKHADTWTAEIPQPRSDTKLKTKSEVSSEREKMQNFWRYTQRGRFADACNVWHETPPITDFNETHIEELKSLYPKGQAYDDLPPFEFDRTTDTKEDTDETIFNKPLEGASLEYYLN